MAAPGFQASSPSKRKVSDEVEDMDMDENMNKAFDQVTQQKPRRPSITKPISSAQFTVREEEHHVYEIDSEFNVIGEAVHNDNYMQHPPSSKPNACSTPSAGSERSVEQDEIEQMSGIEY